MSRKETEKEKKNDNSEYEKKKQHECFFRKLYEKFSRPNHTKHIEKPLGGEILQILRFLKNRPSDLQKQENNEDRIKIDNSNTTEYFNNEMLKNTLTQAGPSKTIIVVSMVKNEERIIESSIRWWMTFATKIIVFDHHSTDNTLSILHNLQEEYRLRIVLFNPSFNTEEYAQAKITNAMIEQAFCRYNADIVMPLDADEFPYLQNNKTSLKKYLCALGQRYCYRTFWMQFAPLHSNEKADMTILLPVSFHRKRKELLDRWPKVIITRDAYKNGPVLVEKGNHTLVKPSGTSFERIVTRDLCPDLCYAHYMYQDLPHFIKKVTENWRTCRVSSEYQPGVAEHYRLAYERIKKGDVDDEVLDYYALSVSGMTGESMEEIKESIEEIDPRSIFGMMKLKYTHVV